MRKLFYITLILALTSCNALHRSIKKSGRHHHEQSTVTTAENLPTQESSPAYVPEQTETELVEDKVETLNSDVLSDIEDRKSVVIIESVSPPEEDEITEEDLEARRKFDKNYRWTLISSIIGGPIGVTLGILTFNPIVLLSITVPFLLFAATLATFQIFKISGNVPDSLVDKKFHRRYIFADIVMIIVFILTGLALLGLVSRYV